MGTLILKAHGTIMIAKEGNEYSADFRYNNVDYEKDEYNGRCYILDTSRDFNSKVAREGGFVRRRISRAVYEEARAAAIKEVEKAAATIYTDRNGNKWQRSTAAREECSRMSWSDVRSLCIAKDFYTGGDCEEYDNLAQLIYSWEDAGQNITPEMLQVVAEDILEHSHTDYDLESIMFELSRHCVRRVYV